ncbi:MAG: N-6 DNA methylase [Elusimicrobiota bacterium]
MNEKEILEDIINNFSIEKFIRFFREKNNKLRYPDESINYYDDESNFQEARKIAEGEVEDGKLIVCSFKVLKELTERSGRKAQYILGKKILKEQMADAGIFIFYDATGSFRFSLIYTNYLGRRRDWSSFKRFTYFVSKEFTNKTFLNQIGNADFSSIEKIKEAFSIEPVTKEFYNEIQSWYFWAMDKIKFPDDYEYSKDPAKDKEIRNSNNLIRLITRIIFIWFLKEKKLIPMDLFLPQKLKDIVKDFMKNKKSSNFYNAILQNLFFATLNQKMGERKFAKDEGYLVNRKEYGIKNLYRYKDKFLISENEVLELFKDIPFLNGGLFDCLDKEDETGIVKYIDGFSRNPAKQAIIPDYLFFQEKEEKVDLSDYGIGDKQVRGLIEILNSYNFTIDENTPIDQEIALDPELLGKVFENLLASYNPETATTARKATGSYYTPREIVDYMVEASLLEYLKEKLPEIDEEKIKLLLSYSEENLNFSEEEKLKIISAIDDIKILDPACGSGAFPMGILHKLVYALQKLDPQNKYWYELQFQKAIKESEQTFKEQDKKQREEHLKEINETFDESINYPDYARKLYLIENCIYGVDIQPIAIQISKLRFFISLILDQKIDRNKENFGIRALPNLETKFVSANTLIGIEKPDSLYYTEKIKKLENEIKDLRHKYFQAKSRTQKLNYQKKDKELREKLSRELKAIGFSDDSSQKIASFDLFDQNTFADWFDPEWMFGVKDGFDIVIGNPPYGANYSENTKKYFKQHYKSAQTIPNKQKGSLDTFTIFIEKGFNLLKKGGSLHYIVPITITSGESVMGIHRLLEMNCEEIKISSYSVRPQPIFQNSVVNTSILFFKKTETPCKRILATKMYRKDRNFSIEYLLKNLEFIDVFNYKLVGRYPKISLDIERKILDKIFAQKTSIRDLLRPTGKPIYYRTTGGRYFKVITNYPTGSTKEKAIYFEEYIANAIGCILSSNLYFWFYQIYSNNLDLKLYEIESFKIPFEKLDSKKIKILEKLYQEYLEDIEANANIRQTTKYTNIDSFKEYKIYKSKHIIDKIDDFIGPLYGLTEEEILFIKEYEIDFRLAGED